jgi:hypothetical protein
MTHHSILLVALLVVVINIVVANLQDEYIALTKRSLSMATPATDYDAYPFAASNKNALFTQHLTGQYASTGRDYSAWFASFHPSSFSFLPPAERGCTRLQTTSKSAVDPWHEFCEYATNGGFFNMGSAINGTFCIGNLIGPKGNIVQLPGDSTTNKRTQIGITKDLRIIIGIIDEQTIAELDFSELMTGYGWLIRNGISYVDSTTDIPQPASNVTFVTEKAPRTTVGFLNNGHMGILQIDGEEDINAGPDLYEVTELGLTVGFTSLVNIDGGGSAVSVLKGKVISVPTCNDTPVECERPDASLTCVRRDVEEE